MAFVATATAVGFGSAILGTAIIGAGVGGLYSAVTGDGDILNSMLTGALIGGAGAGLMTAAGVGGFGAAATAAETAAAAGATGLGSAGPAATAVNIPTAAQMASMTPTQVAAMTPAQLNAVAASQGVLAEGAATLPGANMFVAPEIITPDIMAASGKIAGTVPPTMSNMKALGYGLAGTSAMQLLGGRGKGAQGPASDPGMIRPFEYTSTPNEPTGNYPAPYATASYDESGNPVMDTRERNHFDQKFTALEPYSAKIGTVNPNLPLPASSSVNAANGGIMRNYDDEMGRDDTSLDQGNMQKGLFGLGYAHGGAANLGDYSDGGRLLRGPGDGVSDSIPATIANKQPARLADGEFVIPARIVSELGNGSTDAGAKRLYAMMDRIQAGRKKTIGKKNVAKDTKAKKHLLA